MKLKQFLCYILIFLFSSLAYAQNKGPSGIELCNEVHTFLKKSGFSPSSQSLVISGENTFPYNIIVTFTPEQNSSPENLLLVFFQEDIPDNKLLIKECLKNIRDAHYPFTITALFAYGEKQLFEKNDMIYGTKVYLESLSSNLTYTAAIFDLESEKNEIETTARGLSSPPQLIKNSMNLYKDFDIGENLPKLILSQISSYNFISSRILGSFFENEIPAIKLSLGGIDREKKDDIAVQIITGFIKQFSSNADSSWQHHFLIMELFGSYHTISERMILRFITPTIFLWILFIFTLIFVNRNLQKHTWSTIGKIWWSVPLTYLLLVAGFFVAGILFRNLFSGASYAWKIYGQLVFQICGSLFLVFSAYIIILTLNHGFDELAVDYLLVISCFINQSIFILADISLSPIFILICLLSLLALSVKNNLLHIAFFLLMIAPLVPYGHRMIASADLKELSVYLAKSRGIYNVIPLVLYPVYIVLFRIITSVRTHKKKISSVIVSTIITYVLICTALLSLALIRSSGLNKLKKVQPEIAISPLGNELISLEVSDTEIFDDTIRTLKVSLKKKCLICDVILSTADLNPILYSDNDYTNPAKNTSRFLIPDNPPNEMSFSYGAAKAPCRITVSAVIEGQKEGDYQFISRSLEIGEK